MYYLIYVSQAKQPMDREALATILEKSRNHNSRDGITGLLIYKFEPDDGRGNFMQLLEGDRSAVESAYGRIAADRRHHTIVLLERGDVAQRMFPDWSMGFRNVEAGDLANHPGYTDLGSKGFFDRARAGAIGDALGLMRSFYRDGATAD